MGVFLREHWEKGDPAVVIVVGCIFAIVAIAIFVNMNLQRAWPAEIEIAVEYPSELAATLASPDPFEGRDWLVRAELVQDLLDAADNLWEDKNLDLFSNVEAFDRVFRSIDCRRVSCTLTLYGERSSPPQAVARIDRPIQSSVEHITGYTIESSSLAFDGATLRGEGQLSGVLRVTEVTLVAVLVGVMAFVIGVLISALLWVGGWKLFGKNTSSGW